MLTILEAIATDNPPFKVSQSQALAFMSKVEGISQPLRDHMAKIYTKSGIDDRYTCIADHLYEPPDFQFYPPNWQLSPPPTTAKRNQLYQTYATKLVTSAATKVIQQTNLEPTEITHLIVVSCTGFVAPGLDIQVIQQLGLRSDIDRTLIGFMGCHAALNGLKTAHAICQSHEQAKVLLICVELCTIHFQAEDSLESVVINALFGDGVAAAIISTQSRDEAVGKLAYLDGYSLLAPDTLDLMSWTIGDTGFLMQLSSRVPQAIVQHLPNYLTTLLARNQTSQQSIDFWAIHPGGRQIGDQVQSLLELEDRQVQDSYEVLRQYGNMSSCTILFILQRLLHQHQTEKTLEQGVALAFGPGLTIEGCLFQQVQ
jgi:alpha-pyrone synthase